MKNKKYMVLLADRRRAKMFILEAGAVLGQEDFTDGPVPQKVKHGDDTWDSQDKIFRHIEDHLHTYLSLLSKKVAIFAKANEFDGILIGSHKPLFEKIEKHLPYPFSQKVKGRFVTELKAPFGEILRRAKMCITRLEEERVRTSTTQS